MGPKFCFIALLSYGYFNNVLHASSILYHMICPYHLRIASKSAKEIAVENWLIKQISLF